MPEIGKWLQEEVFLTHSRIILAFCRLRDIMWSGGQEAGALLKLVLLLFVGIDRKHWLGLFRRADSPCSSGSHYPRGPGDRPTRGRARRIQAAFHPALCLGAGRLSLAIDAWPVLGRG